MTKRVVILGGGTGGTCVANRLRRRLGRSEAEILVVDQDDAHLYQPGLLFVPFGMASPDDLARPRQAQFHDGVSFREAAVEHVDTRANQVLLEGGEAIDYDALVIASGSSLVLEETDGLTGPGWMQSVFTFYTPDGARALREALGRFDGGRLVVGFFDLPIKCPVAPLEFCFLADWYFQERGIRDDVDITFVTPLDGAFTKPVASHALGGLLERKGIRLITEFNTGEVDGAGGRLVSYDGRSVPFDLAVVVPLHGGAPYVARSPGLGDELGFIVVNPFTLQSAAAPNVFAVGDAASVPTSKAGSVAHFESDVLVENLVCALSGTEPTASFDGHTNCFIETGFHKALMIDFNYDTEPLAGRFPSAVGVPLLKESRLNHLGKELFEWAYWHALLPGRDLPGVTSRMPERGKARSAGTRRP